MYPLPSCFCNLLCLPTSLASIWLYALNLMLYYTLGMKVQNMKIDKKNTSANQYRVKKWTLFFQVGKTFKGRRHYIPSFFEHILWPNNFKQYSLFGLKLSARTIKLNFQIFQLWYLTCIQNTFISLLLFWAEIKKRLFVYY